MFGRKKDAERLSVPVPTMPDPEPVESLLPKPLSRKAAAVPGRPLAAPGLTTADAVRRPAAPMAPRGRPEFSPSSADGRRLVVGRDIKLLGEVINCDSLVVEGTAELSLTDARHLQIAVGGTFRGDVEVEEADIAGLFEGELAVRERLTVRPSGRVLGRVRYLNLVVEAGGQIVGEMETITVKDTEPVRPLDLDDGRRDHPAGTAEVTDDTPPTAAPDVSAISADKR
jgi:cytoskeletal protein CcmA (bactofilin family)